MLCWLGARLAKCTWSRCKLPAALRAIRGALPRVSCLLASRLQQPAARYRGHLRSAVNPALPFLRKIPQPLRKRLPRPLRSRLPPPLQTNTAGCLPSFRPTGVRGIGERKSLEITGCLSLQKATASSPQACLVSFPPLMRLRNTEIKTLRGDRRRSADCNPGASIRFSITQRIGFTHSKHVAVALDGRTVSRKRWL